MNVASRVLPALIIAASALSLAASAAPNPITVQQCFVTEPKHFSKKASGVQITYVNNAAVTASKVTFAVGYRNSDNRFMRKVTDVGMFAPHQQVDHHFDLYNDVTYGGKTVTSCKAVAVTFANGKTWP